MYACAEPGPGRAQACDAVSSFEHSDFGVVSGALSILDMHGRRAAGAAELLCSRRHNSPGQLLAAARHGLLRTV
jgi:hypothetical protein